MKKTLNLYRNTTYGRTLRPVSLKLSDTIGLPLIKLTNHKSLNERVSKLFMVDVITPAVSYVTTAPLPFPYTALNHNQEVGFIADLRNHLKADTKLSEENNEWAIKSSSFDSVETTVTLLEILSIARDDKKENIIENLLLGDTAKAYITWLSGSINRAVGTNNDFPIVQRVRLACALHFLAKVNDVNSLDDDFLAYAKVQLMRKLGFSAELVDLLTHKRVNRNFDGVPSLALLLVNLTEDPRFDKLTDLSILQTVSSHLYIGNTNHLIMLAVDNPYVFLTCIRFSFTRDFRTRSNFKTLLEQAGMEKSLTDTATTLERVINGYFR